MTKRDLINLVKYNKLFYRLYFYCGSYALRFLGLFIKQNPKRIVFSSFGGRKYDDSSRCIFEAMIKDPRFKGYDFVWALGNPESFEIQNARKVKCDTFAYYRTLLAAKVWVTNSSMERGLSFKPKRIFNLNTWHGTAIKLMGRDRKEGSKTYRAPKHKCHEDIMLAQGMYDVNIFSRVMNIPKENFRVIGLPRNDELIHKNTEFFRANIRKKLNLPNGKKVILYAPTFREYDQDAAGNCRLTLPIDLRKREKELSNEYILLIRAHYEIVKGLKLQENSFIRDMSSYPNLNELMIVSDLLISDYSSIFFDYSLQDKPMLCFAYDYDKYDTLRGMYFDIREKVQNCSDEDSLINLLKTLREDTHIRKTIKFREEFIEAFGDASMRTSDLIWEKIHLN